MLVRIFPLYLLLKIIGSGIGSGDQPFKVFVKVNSFN